MRVSAIVLAAGRGQRFKSRIPKALALIDSTPVIAYSLGILQRNRCISEIIVVANSSTRRAAEKIKKAFRFSKLTRIVLGGKERQDSVACGLKVINPATDLVVIHDAARPFVTSRLINALIKEAQKTKAAIVAVPVKATIKRATGSIAARRAARSIAVKETLDRKGLWEAQTPQVFKKELIVEAYRRFRKIPVTDDATLVEKLKVKVSIVMGSYRNLKITTLEDLVIARAIAKANTQ